MQLLLYYQVFFLFYKEGNCHEGAKPQRVVFCSNMGFLFSTGFTRMSQRVWAVWDQVCTICILPVRSDGMNFHGYI